MSWLSHDWIGAKHVAPYISLHERCLENSMEELTFHKNQPSNQPLLPILCGSYSGRSRPQYIRSVFWCSFHFFFYPSGKRLHCELERSTMPFNGKIHYFDWAMASIANCWHNQRYHLTAIHLCGFCQDASRRGTSTESTTWKQWNHGRQRIQRDARIMWRFSSGTRKKIQWVIFIDHV